ncbi:MAG: AEC family transporter [Pararhodobacter sp.]|nr:AEC family transporter [Pararhodobacter sp.]
MTLIDTLVPLFAVIGLGFGAVRLGLVPAQAVPALGALVIRLALPALIFLALTGASPAEFFDRALLLAYAAGSLATMGLCVVLARFVFRLDRPEIAVIAIGVSMSNSGFMGFPIGQALLGSQAATTVFAHAMMVENLVILPIGLILLARVQSGGVSGRALAADLARNPLILALAAGVTASALGITLPGVATATLGLLAQIASPLALLVIGGMLASLSGGARARPVALILAGKLALHPLAVWAAAAALPGAASPLTGAGILFAAMPMVTIFPLLCARAGAVSGRLAAVALMAATLASFFTLPVAIRMLGLA